MLGSLLISWIVRKDVFFNFPPFAARVKHNLNMKTLLIVTLMAFGMTYGLDLGRGGVYNSPAAQEYWARRFGRGFFANLASVQRNINDVAAKNKLVLETAVPEEALVENDIDTGNEIARKMVEMEQAPAVLTIQPGPLFFGQVHF